MINTIEQRDAIRASALMRRASGLRCVVEGCEARLRRSNTTEYCYKCRKAGRGVVPAPLRSCSLCGGPILPRNKAGVCTSCRKAGAKFRRTNLRCKAKGCTAILSRREGTGYCKAHFTASPDWLAANAAQMEKARAARRAKLDQPCRINGCDNLTARWSATGICTPCRRAGGGL